MKTYKSTQAEKMRAMVGKDARYKFLKDVARERAGVGSDYGHPAPAPKDESAPQAVGDRNNLRAENYDKRR